jgi:multidrug efflux pump subunit AcrA (membrane-fusion protein)
MKKTLITTGIVAAIAIIALFVINKVFSKDESTDIFAEAASGNFEITISSTGELLAENSVDIMGPEIAAGRDVRSTNIKITDLIAEGTEVKKGDYVGTLDRTELDNSLKDFRQNLTEMNATIEMLLLDTAMTMNSIRDQINNQKHTVEEAEITLRNSKFEPPTTIRQAEINLEQAKRNLDQLKRSYTLRDAQTKVNVRNRRLFLSRMERRVKDYEEVLAGFVITAPSSGMVIYKKDRFGNKRKVGSNINPMDRAIATLPDLSVMLSKVFVSEIEVNKVLPGQTVIITIDAFPEKSYYGKIISVANIGEKLPNSDSKVFEVMAKIDGTDFNLRPSMTTNNKIMIRTFENVVYVPTECIHTGADSLPSVFTKSGHRQIVLLGEANEKEVIIEKGLEPGTEVYLGTPEKPEDFRLAGEEYIETIRERERLRYAASTARQVVGGNPIKE